MRTECTLLQKKIVEHNQSIPENNTLQLKLELAKKDRVSGRRRSLISEVVISVPDGFTKGAGHLNL